MQELCRVLASNSKWRHDTRHKDTQHNDIQRNDVQHKGLLEIYDQRRICIESWSVLVLIVVMLSVVMLNGKSPLKSYSINVTISFVY